MKRGLLIALIVIAGASLLAACADGPPPPLLDPPTADSGDVIPIAGDGAPPCDAMVEDCGGGSDSKDDKDPKDKDPKDDDGGSPFGPIFIPVLGWIDPFDFDPCDDDFYALFIDPEECFGRDIRAWVLSQFPFMGGGRGEDPPPPPPPPLPDDVIPIAGDSSRPPPPPPPPLLDDVIPIAGDSTLPAPKPLPEGVIPIAGDSSAPEYSRRLRDDDLALFFLQTFVRDMTGLPDLRAARPAAAAMEPIRAGTTLLDTGAKTAPLLSRGTLLEQAKSDALGGKIAHPASGPPSRSTLLEEAKGDALRGAAGKNTTTSPARNGAIDETKRTALGHPETASKSNMSTSRRDAEVGERRAKFSTPRKSQSGAVFGNAGNVAVPTIQRGSSFPTQSGELAGSRGFGASNLGGGESMRGGSGGGSIKGRRF